MWPKMPMISLPPLIENLKQYSDVCNHMLNSPTNFQLQFFFQDCLHTKDKVKEAGINNFSKTENPPMCLIERKCIEQGFLMNTLNFTLETGQAHVSSKYSKNYVTERDFDTCMGVHTS